MSLLPALNDKDFLHQLMDMAREHSRTQEAHALAAMLLTVQGLILYIQSLTYRSDTGDPLDGPRIGNGIPQRVRMFPIDPNCVERTVIFLALVILLAPHRFFTAATLSLDEGFHTFPVEITDTSAKPIILDSNSTQLRNLMSAAVYQIRNASPMGRAQLVPWFMDLARHACISQNMEDCYHIANRALRRALVTGTSIENRDELGCMLALAENDAQLFGPLGGVAYQRVRNSIADLDHALETRKVSQLLDAHLRNGPNAGDILKAALIAQFGPAAELAFYGSKIDIDDVKKTIDKVKKVTKKKKVRKLTKQERKRLLRRMTHVFKP